MRVCLLRILPAMLLMLCRPVALPADAPSHEQVITSAAERIAATVPPKKILQLQPEELIPLLSDSERQALSSGHVSFRVNVPVKLTLFRNTDSDAEPFWLQEKGFEQTDFTVRADGKRYDGWQREYEAGEISLGIGSLRATIYPYFLVLQPVNPQDRVRVSSLSPSRLKLGTFEDEAQPLIDRDIVLSRVPPELAGSVLVRTSRSHSRGMALLDRFLQTKYPSSARADHVVLTWSQDPRTSITIQWRSGASVQKGLVRYRQGSSGQIQTVMAQSQPLATPTIVNDPLIHLHAATLRNLRPGTQYQYSVGDGTPDNWLSWVSFTTAPAKPTSFSFTYLGDAQNGLDSWGDLLHEAFRKHPGSAFYILAGDLIDRGHDRDDWDSFFHNAQGVFDRRVFVPVLGNHEVLHSKPPTLYLSFFNLPQDGPPSIDPERAYAFEYSNALFVILDSNLDPKLQTDWLEQQLSRSSAQWKFVSFHHPIYASHPDRNHDHLLKEWAPLFDRYGVDMVLQGHDHAYLRTHRMYDNKPSLEKRGTYYVVSVSGTKYYEQADHDYTAVGFEQESTYQVIKIEVGQDSLHYRAFDRDGEIRDELVIKKSSASLGLLKP